MRSSKKAVTLIVAAEVGSQALYERGYSRPTWPGGKSGVTVAIGYDLGYTTAEQIGADFAGLLPAAMIVAMQNVAGIKGSAASAALLTVKTRVSVPWDAACSVFLKVDLPRYEQMLLHACPRSMELPADCFGALTSIVYNRGAGGFTAPDDRYKEMRDIRAAIATGKHAEIPGHIRAMKRLWGPDQRGLLIRRDNEAKLFEEGLVNGGVIPPFLQPTEVTPVGTPPKDPAVEAAQRNLKSMHYHEVGEVDGLFGGKVKAAIIVFMDDRGRDPGKGELTPEVQAEITAAMAEKWTRPIKKSRRTATAKDIAGKVASVNSTWWQKAWAFALGLPSATAAVFKFMFGDEAKVSDYVDPVKNFFAAFPPELYFAVAAAIAVAIFIQAKRSQDATVKAYQTGEIN